MSRGAAACRGQSCLGLEGRREVKPQRTPAPGARRAPRPLRGYSRQGRTRGLSRALSTECPVAPAVASPLRTNAHFPLFMLLWDSHSFQLSKLGTVLRLHFSQSLSVACLAGRHSFQVPYPRVGVGGLQFPNWVPETGLALHWWE